MNALLIFMAAVAMPCVLGYDEKYDKLDVDKILADDALFTSYIDCMLDKGACTLEHSAEFRQLLPEVIATACEKCNKIQRENVRKTVKTLNEKRPEEFSQFRAKYDPTGEFEKDFTAFVVGTD